MKICVFYIIRYNVNYFYLLQTFILLHALIKYEKNKYKLD